MTRYEIDLSFTGNLDEINNFKIETLGTLDYYIIASIGESRNILLKTSYLNSIPRLVEKRSVLSMVPLTYGETVAMYFDLKLYDMPFDVKPFEHQMVWHKSHENSSSHKWLRDYIRDGYWDFIQ